MILTCDLYLFQSTNGAVIKTEYVETEMQVTMSIFIIIIEHKNDKKRLHYEISNYPLHTN